MSWNDRRSLHVALVAVPILFLCHGESPAAVQLELTARIDSARLQYHDEPITVSECAMTSDSSFALLDLHTRSVFRVDRDGPVTLISSLEDLGIGEHAQISGMWFADGFIYLAVSGRDPALVRFCPLNDEIRTVKPGVQIMDLDAWGDCVVATPATGPTGALPQVLILQPELAIVDSWGTACPPEFDLLDPALKIGCMNSVAIDAEDNVFVASLNTGRCDRIRLKDRVSTAIRSGETDCAVPRVSGAGKVTTDMVLLDIAASKQGSYLFILTSPKGRLGIHALEIYRHDVLLETVDLGRPFGSVVCGPGNGLALIASSSPALISVYRMRESK